MRVRYEKDDIGLVETDQAHLLRLPVDIVRAARRKIQILKQARDERDLAALYSLRYKKLSGSRAEVRSIRLNKQWRIIFRFDESCDPIELVIIEISKHYE